MFCAIVRDVTEKSVTAMRTICYPPVKWCTEVDAIDHVGPSYPPASNGHISALQLFGFLSNTTTDFPEKLSTISVGHFPSSVEIGYLIKS
ncbi:hypothetical protein TNCV_2320361 [Trichonephila clavipes]|nr:hypothetical protein TNCV_2320361 [Trichonephila clavipes]